AAFCFCFSRAFLLPPRKRDLLKGSAFGRWPQRFEYDWQEPANHCIQRLCALSPWNQYFATKGPPSTNLFSRLCAKYGGGGGPTAGKQNHRLPETPQP